MNTNELFILHIAYFFFYFEWIFKYVNNIIFTLLILLILLIQLKLRDLLIKLNKGKKNILFFTHKCGLLSLPKTPYNNYNCLFISPPIFYLINRANKIIHCK